jgi:4-amino-4-deoxy-L-arabinose transferase-like glycosyltransferase
MLAKRGTFVLFLAVVAFYLYGLGNFPLVGPDEPRYAQVAREMFLRRDLITPTLGGHTWFEKPALLYWMMIASFKLFGVSEWSARLPAAICGPLTIMAVYCIGRRVARDDLKLRAYAFWSTLAAATTLGIVVFARAASFDIILTMTTTWALAFYFLGELEQKAKLRRWFLIGFYTFIGLSLLAKGLAGIVIPGGVVGLYYLIRLRLPERNTLISLLWGIPLALIVAATWYGPVISRHGWLFIDQFFIQHHLARYVSNKYHHQGPVYYYLLVVPLLALPWTAFFVDGVLQARGRLRRARVSTSDHVDDRFRRLLTFALAWFLFPLLFFSFAQSKLPGYILPALPAVALIVGERLWRLSSEPGKRNWTVIATGALCLLAAIGSVVYSWRDGDLPVVCMLLIGTPLFIAGCFALFLRRRPSASIVLIGGAVLSVMIVSLLCVARQVAELESSKHLLQLADARGYSQKVIYGMQRSDRTPEFYAAGRVAYGADGEPFMYEDPVQVIAESQRRGDIVLVFIPINEVSKLTGMASAQTDVIGNNGRNAIVAVNYKNSPNP